MGVPHTGEDWNLRTGGDSDLGYPVQAVFPGTVVAAGWYRVWGNLVVVRVDPWVQELLQKALGEPLEDLYVRYGHLHHTVVTQGQQVDAGECIGSIGKGDGGRYMAHLHIDFPGCAFPRMHTREQKPRCGPSTWTRPGSGGPELRRSPQPPPFGAPLRPRALYREGPRGPRGAWVRRVEERLWVRPVSEEA
ncbi:M23 family metallopeptidase [Thermus antranikianii]|uniref:M23 family metallopeptidase n=1 Tax=Thermus antranikianii TaxID=88190 RepID=UPI003C6EAEEA